LVVTEEWVGGFRCVFAAKLWEVFKKRAIEEYQDPEVFFEKTYLTDGLKNLLNIAEKRLKGKGGNSVIQLQTPFGGGKTHSLIALYHKAKDWKANVAVIVGDVLDPKETLMWEELEKQLAGKVTKLKGQTSPGGEKLRELFASHQPLLILMDEILEYAIPASGIKVGESTQASQVMSFMRSLTETVGTLDKTFLVLTYPSGAHYDETGQKLLDQLQERSGRVEKLYTPVQEEEISSVIRRRLFSNVDELKARRVIDKFLDYAEKEKILPKDLGRAAYRKSFTKSYPFQPEAIDTLYKRWGSFYEFGRTRGVLRLLSLVIHSLKEANLPYIRLADFDLAEEEIKREFLRCLGPEYDPVIAADITSSNAGAKRVDKTLGDAFIPFSFGTGAATTIFLQSFSGGPEKETTLSDVKLSAVHISAPSAVVAEAVSKLRDSLFYVHDKELRFTNKPNLNRILLTKMENVGDLEIQSEEKALLASSLGKEHFEVFIWPMNSRDVPNTKNLKLVVMRDRDEKRCKEILEKCGDRPRVYPNVLVFVCPWGSERVTFEELARRKIAWELIDKDLSPSLSADQGKDVKSKLEAAEGDIRDKIRSLYRFALLPSKEGFKEVDLGVPTYGTEASITQEVYERLRSEGEVLERFSPLSLKEKYLKGKDYVETKRILDSFFTTPGETRIVSDDVLGNCIKEGVKDGLFGIGNVENEKPIARHFKDESSPGLVEGEVLIKPESCKPPEEEIPAEEEKEEEEVVTEKGKYKKLHLVLNVPSGRLADIVRTINYLKTVFENVTVRIDVTTRKGEISTSDYEDKVREGFEQAGIGVEKEETD